MLGAAILAEGGFEIISKESLGILYFLLPGFVAAWVFYGLTAHPRRDQTERVIQGLIFTAFVQSVVFMIRGTSILFGKWFFSVGRWNADVSLVWSVIVALVMGVVFSWIANSNCLHRWLQKKKISKRTSYPSEWYSAFDRYQRYAVLHLKGERRLKGWIEEWPDHPDKGHFIIDQPMWLDDAGNLYPQSLIERFLLPAAEVEMVEFWYSDSKLPKSPEELIAERDALAALQKETKDEREITVTVAAASTTDSGAGSESGSDTGNSDSL
jgi:hypothetical protein